MSKTGLSKISLITNSIFSLLSWFLPIVIGFIATPMIVKSLGNRDYGLYAVILGFVSYSFTFGVGRILMKYVAEYRGSGESDKIGEVASATFWLSLGIALSGTLIVVFSAKFIVSEVLYLPADQQEVGVVGLYLACAAIIATMLSQIFQFILQGLNRFGSYSLLTNISGVLLNIGNVTLALLGYGIVPLLMWNFVALTIMAAAFGYDAVRNLPEFSIRPNFRSKAWPAVLRYGSNIVLYQVFGNILLAFERAWIVRKFGPETATFYIIPMMLAIYMNGIIGSALVVLFPTVNELLGDRERLTELYHKASKLMVAIICLLSTMLICGGRPLLQLWINDEMATRSYSILVLHVLTFSLIAGMMMVWQLAEGFRAPSYNTLATFMWSLVAIPLMILTADAWNIEGIAFSRLVGVAVTMPLLFVVERRFLGSSHWRFWGAITWRVVAASGAMAAFLVAFFRYVPTRWVFVAAGFAIGGAVFGLTLLVTGFLTADERETIRNMVLRRKTV